MGGKTTMDKRGHHVCSFINYQVRQRIVKPTTRKVGGREVSSPGTVEVMIYKSKNKIEGNMKDVKQAAQKIYDLLKDVNRETYVEKKLIRKYGLV